MRCMISVRSTGRHGRLAEEERAQMALDELHSFLKEWQAVEDNKQGSTAFYSIVGQKADFV